MSILISADSNVFVVHTTKTSPIHPQGGTLKLVQHEHSVAICFDSSEGPICYVDGDMQGFFDAVSELAAMVKNPPPEPEPEPEEETDAAEEEATEEPAA